MEVQVLSGERGLFAEVGLKRCVFQFYFLAIFLLCIVIYLIQIFELYFIFHSLFSLIFFFKSLQFSSFLLLFQLQLFYFHFYYLYSFLFFIFYFFFLFFIFSFSFFFFLFLFSFSFLFFYFDFHFFVSLPFLGFEIHNRSCGQKHSAI